MHVRSSHTDSKVQVYTPSHNNHTSTAAATAHTHQTIYRFHHAHVLSAISHQRVKKSALIHVRKRHLAHPDLLRGTNATTISAKHTLTAGSITQTQHTTAAYHHPCEKSTVHHPHPEKSAIIRVRRRLNLVYTCAHYPQNHTHDVEAKRNNTGSRTQLLFRLRVHTVPCQSVVINPKTVEMRVRRRQNARVQRILA